MGGREDGRDGAGALAASREREVRSSVMASEQRERTGRGVVAEGHRREEPYVRAGDD